MYFLVHLCIPLYIYVFNSNGAIYVGEFELKSEDDSDDDVCVFDNDQDLCLPALRYLKQCAHFLASMWKMPNCPVFTGANR